MSPNEIAGHLLGMAARKSTETCFGWAHPDCEALQEAARLLKGEPVPAVSKDAVLSVMTEQGRKVP